MSEINKTDDTLMRMTQANDIYIDYLITQNGHSTATGCFELLDNQVKQDSFTRMLQKGDYDAQFIWSSNTASVRQAENDDGVLILDNSICHKLHRQVNEIINYHYDHAEGRTIKGINLLTVMVKYDDVAFPVGFEGVKKDQLRVKENKKGKAQRYRYSRYTINELTRSLVQQALYNHVNFKDMLGDSWFASKENILFFHQQKYS